MKDNLRPFSVLMPLVKNQTPVLPVLAAGLLATSLVLMSCTVSDNTRPSISVAAETDITLDIRDMVPIAVTITDPDFYDGHTVTAVSDDPAVATVSVRETTVIVTGTGVGVTAIEVSARDDSGHDNAEAAPVTFFVTVNIPPFIGKGVCAVGMRLRPGETCRYVAGSANVVFSVQWDGLACREGGPVVQEILGFKTRFDSAKTCGNTDIDTDKFFNSNFAASRNADGSWTVRRVP